MARLRRGWAMLFTDRRRLAPFGIAIAIGLLFWARFIVISDAPRTAIADECETPETCETRSATPSDRDEPGAQTAPTE